MLALRLLARRRLPPALRHRDFRRLWLGVLASGVAEEMLAVAVGWQVYAIHRSALDLGLIGLAAFVPLPLLALPAGQLADRLPRTAVFAGSLAMEGVVAALLLTVTLTGAHRLWPFVSLAALTGAAGAFGSPAARALAPELVPGDLLAGALALRSIAYQVATVSGPAVGGLLFAVRPELVYAVALGLSLLGAAMILRVAHDEVAEPAAVEPPPKLESLLVGIRFIRETPVIFGAILLDLVAVLFGGAVALLPLYARTILHTGPVGLGVLRSAPAVGALVAGIRLARRPLGGRAGRTLLVVVAGFGVCMVVFGLSRWFALSAVALAASGFVDMFSMNIRSTTVAFATPNEVRGRVNAVEWVFISASNELGAFESGAAAALVGAVPAVVAGGALTIAFAAVWGRFFPSLASVDRMEDLVPRRAEAA
ncbi:MAG TPA: MFS transporter [Gaiellaceae bacterium]|nr:MFS transporter [Gaiellaceae bacterium]